MSQYGIIFIIEAINVDNGVYVSITSFHKYIADQTSFVTKYGIKTHVGGIFQIDMDGILTRVAAAPSSNNCDIYAL